MLAQVFSFLAQFWRMLLPWYVLDSEQVGFVRRLGVPRHDATPGFHLKWPVLDTLEAESTAEYSAVVDPQSLTTSDGVEVIVRATVCCHVFDARRYFLNVTDGKSNIQDLVGGELGWLVTRRSSKDVLTHRILAELTRRSAKAARRWGIHVEDIKLLDAVAAPTCRVLQNQITSSGQE
jgi:regulator of protease activity HflC (stomatin/prohibitin superfamily)